MRAGFRRMASAAALKQTGDHDLGKWARPANLQPPPPPSPPPQREIPVSPPPPRHLVWTRESAERTRAASDSNAAPQWSPASNAPGPSQPQRPRAQPIVHEQYHRPITRAPKPFGDMRWRPGQTPAPTDEHALPNQTTTPSQPLPRDLTWRRSDNGQPPPPVVRQPQWGQKPVQATVSEGQASEVASPRPPPPQYMRWSRGQPIVPSASTAQPRLLRSMPQAEERFRRDKEPEGVQQTKKKKKLVNARDVRVKTDLYVPEVITVGNLAKLLNVPLWQLQKTMRQAGMEENTDYDQVISYEYSSLLVQEFGKNAVMNEEAAFDIFPTPEPADSSSLPLRPPIVTIMGHVDHGKTTLLDTLRSTSVAKGEAGGITQHIGAFSVPVKGSTQTITFLDTPGHAAFSAMRARGASVTDIIVLVVAADDGVMDQTKEVIELIKKDIDNVGVVVALNKCDKHGADPDTCRLELMAEGIELESHGGDIPAVEVSGMTGKGLDELVETLSVVSEMMDLRAEREGPVHGFVIESKVVKGMGAVATVLVHRGALLPGATLICGTTSARVRMMSDHTGKAVKVAYPGDAVTVAGWKEVPTAGDEVLQGTEDDVKRALDNRVRRTKSVTMLEDAQAINTYRRVAKEKREADAAEEAAAKQKNRQPQPEEEVEEVVEKKWEDNTPKELRIVVKADVSGSAEAVVGALQEIGNHQAYTKIIHSGVGDVTESDINLAKTAEGMVVAFNVKCSRPLEVIAEKSGVDVFSSGIIYRLTDDIRKRVTALIPPIIEKKVIGEVNVLALFEVGVKGKKKPLKVAGCRIANGIVQKTKLARVVREGKTIFEGRIETLKHHKEDVMEMKKGQDCGLALHGFNEPEVGDLIQIINIIEKPGTL